MNGVFDLPAPGRVAGWAIDRADPDAAVEVEILREGTVVARVRADRFRPDLERGGIGTGRYGFAVDLDPPVARGMEFTIAARAITKDAVSGPLRPTGATAPTEDPVQHLLESVFTEVRTLQARIDALQLLAESGAQRSGNGEMPAILERIEVVQARIELAARAVESGENRRQDAGLRIAVGVALAVGIAALALGIRSVIG